MTKHRGKIERLADPSKDEEMKRKIILKPGGVDFSAVLSLEAYRDGIDQKQLENLVMIDSLGNVHHERRKLQKKNLQRKNPLQRKNLQRKNLKENPLRRKNLQKSAVLKNVFEIRSLHKSVLREKVPHDSVLYQLLPRFHPQIPFKT